MRIAWRWVGLGVALALVGCGDGLQEYVSEEGGFRVLFPAAPSTAPDPDLPRGVRKVSHVERSGSYAVAWEEVGDGEGGAAERLDRACDAAVKKLKGKELARSTIKLHGEHPGRELVIEWPDGRGVTHQRMYLVEGRLYQVVASGLKWWMDTPRPRKVLDSFRLAGQ
jgi:hypothetical protein